MQPVKMNYVMQVKFILSPELFSHCINGLKGTVIFTHRADFAKLWSFIGKGLRSKELVSRPGQRQGLLYNHLCALFLHSVMVCENIFTAPPRPIS